jgi:hypothetical protein
LAISILFITLANVKPIKEYTNMEILTGIGIFTGLIFIVINSIERKLNRIIDLLDKINNKL